MPTIFDPEVTLHTSSLPPIRQAYFIAWSAAQPNLFKPVKVFALGVLLYEQYALVSLTSFGLTRYYTSSATGATMYELSGDSLGTRLQWDLT